MSFKTVKPNKNIIINTLEELKRSNMININIVIILYQLDKTHEKILLYKINNTLYTKVRLYYLLYENEINSSNCSDFEILL